HDATLDRVQRRPGRPEALSIDELAEAGIPTLAAVLAAAGPGPFLDVELKGEPVPEVIPVLEVARGTALARAVVSSFEADTIAWIGDQRPGWPRWLNAMDLAPSTLRLAAELGCSGVSVEWHEIDAAGMTRAASMGLEVAAWTVGRRATAARLERLGVVAICVEAAALDG
ncbi:MAG TPA: glycerophosphodiester phosphodiesterase, partial [Candidatus Limnocylindrales bacterium]|nr:glycerophosphodiester phosphodiesterase [Candidatus Limnocylindrales bacterium]